MITGVHGMFYSDQAEALRRFLRDQVGLPARDVGGGWLIYDLPSAEVGVHPVDHPGAPRSGTHDVSFVCDDIHATVAELRARGVQLDGEVTDQGYGWVIRLTMPGGVQVDLTQPKY